MHSLSRRALALISQQDLLHPGDAVVVGLSGGPDSVALVLALTDLTQSGDLPLDIRLAHLNHGLRAEEADADEEFCAELAGRLALPLTVGHAGDIADGHGSLEARARRARYAFLGRVALDAGAPVVATGHHADDVAETVLLRLLRGSAIRGLGAVPPARPLGSDAPGVRLVRPLLDVSRSEVLGFLHDRGQPYRVDRSNRDIALVRNRIRHSLLPALRRDFPTFSVESLCALNRSAREASQFIERALEEAWPGLCRRSDEECVVLDAQELARLDPALRGEAVRRAVWTLDAEASRGLSAEQLRAAAMLGGSAVGTQVSLPRGLTGRREHGAVFVGRASEESGVTERALHVPGELPVPEAGLVLHCEAAAEGSIGPDRARELSSALEVYVDGTYAAASLKVRCRRPGDRFRPLGAPGTLRLKRFFIDQHVPRHERDRVPLVTTPDGRIIWVVGYRIAHPFRLRGRGEAVLHLWAVPSQVGSGR